MRLVVGLFNASLPRFLAGLPALDVSRGGGDRRVPRTHHALVSFLHIDADLFSSASTVLRLLLQSGRLARGAVLVFDEIINYPGFRQGEMRALWELARLSGRRLEVVGYPGPKLLTDDRALELALRAPGAEQGRFPQDAAFQIW